MVGVIPLRGHKGSNTVDFAGRAEGRNLRPGGYLLSLSSVRRPAGNAPTSFVKVVSKRRSVPAKAGARRPTCTDAQALAAVPAFRLLRREGSDGSEGTAPRSTKTPAATPRDALPAVPPAHGDDQHVLGVAIPGPRLGPGPSAGTLERLIWIGILTLIAAILLTTLVLVGRFFRGTWNP